MTRPVLILVAGPPGSGKTTLADRLAADPGLPLISKDETIKERPFETLGWDNLDWTRKLGRATYAVLDAVLDALMRSGSSVIVESPFRQAMSSRFRELVDRYGFEAVQLVCAPPREAIVERFRARRRHPGHADEELTEDDLNDLIDEYAEPLDTGGVVRLVDTTTHEATEYPAFLELVRSLPRVAQGSLPSRT